MEANVPPMRGAVSPGRARRQGAARDAGRTGRWRASAFVLRGDARAHRQPAPHAHASMHDVHGSLTMRQGISHSARKIARDPLGFAAQTVRAFRANQGLLLAGGVAYYTLLSIVPLMLLLVIILSHVVDAERLLATLARYLDIVAPGQAGPLVNELRGFISHREVIGWTLAVTLIFFSSLAFSVLENAMSVIFYHRVLATRRPFVVSVLIPYLYILFLGVGLLIVTLVAGALQSLGLETLDVLGRDWSLSAVSRALLYLIGLGGEVLVLTSIYFVMPVGRLSWRHALIGGVSATVLWEISRHVLVWYLATLSQVQMVYGSLTTAIVVLLSLELAAIVLLFGAQVIAEYERIEWEPVERKPEALHTPRG
jgi:membrane protein